MRWLPSLTGERLYSSEDALRFGPCLLWGVLDGVGWPAMFVWWRGDMYVKRFLRGVEGVPELGNGEIAAALGGVCIRVESLTPVAEGIMLVSGDRLGGVGWGIVESNISARSTFEYVRFAASAVRN